MVNVKKQGISPKVLGVVPAHQDKKKIIAIVGVTLVILLLLVVLIGKRQFAGKAIATTPEALAAGAVGFPLTADSFMEVGAQEKFPLYASFEKNAYTFSLDISYDTAVVKYEGVKDVQYKTLSDGKSGYLQSNGVFFREKKGNGVVSFVGFRLDDPNDASKPPQLLNTLADASGKALLMTLLFSPVAQESSKGAYIKVKSNSFGGEGETQFSLTPIDASFGVQPLKKQACDGQQIEGSEVCDGKNFKAGEGVCPEGMSGTVVCKDCNSVDVSGCGAVKESCGTVGDEDNDGSSDCADSDCASDAACVGEAVCVEEGDSGNDIYTLGTVDITTDKYSAFADQCKEIKEYYGKTVTSGQSKYLLEYYCKSSDNPEKGWELVECTCENGKCLSDAVETICVVGAQNKDDCVIEFKDGNLKKHLIVLMNDVDGKITLKEALAVTKLDFKGNEVALDIESLEGMQFFSNLKDLMLNGYKSTKTFSDVHPLSGLTSLQTLSLNYGQIVDISALSGLTQLKTLQLSFNKIIDISSLSGLTQLKFLYFGNNQIKDISILKGFQLIGLDVHLNPLPENCASTGPIYGKEKIKEFLDKCLGGDDSKDTDGDGVVDTKDNCPGVANVDQKDADSDKQGDVCDTDDDNDGFSDEDEKAKGTNPLDAASKPTSAMVVKGDVECSGDVTNKDALLVKKFVLGEISTFVKSDQTLCETGLKAADVDCSAEITNKDALLIKKFVLGDIAGFTKSDGSPCTE